MVQHGAEDPYWFRCGIALYITTWDVAVENCTVDPYWGRDGRLWTCRSLLGNLRYSRALLIHNGTL